MLLLKLRRMCLLKLMGPCECGDAKKLWLHRISHIQHSAFSHINEVVGRCEQNVLNSNTVDICNKISIARTILEHVTKLMFLYEEMAIICQVRFITLVMILSTTASFSISVQISGELRK